MTIAFVTETVKDLFGNEVAERDLPTAPGEKGRRKPIRPKGYAAPPGTGPAGETCGTCHHQCSTGRGGKFKKCGLLRLIWTNGPGTDIRLKSPACSFWMGKGGRP